MSPPRRDARAILEARLDAVGEPGPFSGLELLRDLVVFHADIPEERDLAFDALVTGEVRLALAVVASAVEDGDERWLRTNGEWIHGFRSLAHFFGRDEQAWREHLRGMMRGRTRGKAGLRHVVKDG